MTPTATARRPKPSYDPVAELEAAQKQLAEEKRQRDQLGVEAVEFSAKVEGREAELTKLAIEQRESGKLVGFVDPPLGRSTRPPRRICSPSAVCTWTSASAADVAAMAGNPTPPA